MTDASPLLTLSSWAFNCLAGNLLVAEACFFDFNLSSFAIGQPE
jgi:hypothetical protein